MVRRQGDSDKGAVEKRRLSTPPSCLQRCPSLHQSTICTTAEEKNTSRNQAVLGTAQITHGTSSVIPIFRICHQHCEGNEGLYNFVCCAFGQRKGELKEARELRMPHRAWCNLYHIICRRAPREDGAPA